MTTEQKLSRPFEVGARVRYWANGRSYQMVTVEGYTEGGRVRVRWPVNAAGYTQVSAVKQTSLSTI